MLEIMLKSINKKRSNQKGFTLVELIVVIAILGILAAVAIPRLTGFSGSANAKAALSTLSSIESAAQAYATENNVTLATVTEANVLSTLGWTAMPTASPKGVTYSFASGVASAGVAAGTPWPVSTTTALTGVTAATIKGY